MNFSISGFGRTQADGRNTIPTQDNGTATPRKSVVQVQFPCFGHSLAYYNDQFDLHPGDRVYVDGKLERSALLPRWSTTSKSSFPTTNGSLPW